MNVPIVQQQQQAVLTLNCIVDESALLAGLKENPQDNLKHWINAGSINLFVPLYTLEQLRKLRDGNKPSGQDARRVLAWLDQITSDTESKIFGRVELQGPEDQYSSWQEVEKYLLPDTPLSAPNGSDLDGTADELEILELNDSSAQDSTQSIETINVTSGSGFSMNPASPSFTPKQPCTTSTSTNGVIQNGNLSTIQLGERAWKSTNKALKSDYRPRQGTAAIPARVRPLLNFVVWRTYNSNSPIKDTGKNILLTNDINTQKQAQKFGVRAKLLSQLRSIVAREGKRGSRGQESKSDMAYSATETALSEGSISEFEADDGEDRVLFNPSERPSSSRGALKVWDPDHFGRSQPSPTLNASVPVSPEPTKRTPAASSPNNRSVKGGVPRGSSNGRGRGQKPSRGRSAAVPTVTQSKHQFTQPIDPDSYARPQPAGGKRGRGAAARRLWDPS